MLNPRRVLSKSQILQNVWHYDFGGNANVVETYISYLRRKLDATGHAGETEVGDRASVTARINDAELGITTTQLNTGFRAARKALITAQIEALADGDIDADEPAELKAELDDADLPGYKPSRFRGGGFGRGHGHGR